jgi:hypothetical protein
MEGDDMSLPPEQVRVLRLIAGGACADEQIRWGEIQSLAARGLIEVRCLRGQLFVAITAAGRRLSLALTPS